MSGIPVGRVPPHSLEAERALIGSVMLEPEVYATVKGTAHGDSFYSPAHQAIWEAFDAISRRSEAIDYIAVRTELSRTNLLGQVGGDEYLLGLTDTLPTAALAQGYANRVRDDARARTLIRSLHEMASLGYEMTSWSEYRAIVESAIRSITTAEVDGEPVHVSKVIAGSIQEIHEKEKRGLGALVGHRSGLTKLDDLLGGWQRQRLYVVAGRPGMGKSALTTATVEQTTQDGPGLFFSIEMPPNEVGLRMLVSGSGIDMTDAQSAKLTRGHWLDIHRTSKHLASLPIYIDTTTTSLEQVTAKSRRFRTKHGKVGWIIIDYLQLMRGDKRLPREQQIAEISRELKALSKELDCPVIALSQLNRACEDRPDKRPQLSDLRESGAIEQDADAVVFVFRRGYYAALQKNTKTSKRGRWDSESEIAPGDDDGITELIVAKNRGGRTGIAKCLFQGMHTRFVDLEQSSGYGYGDG